MARFEQVDRLLYVRGPGHLYVTSDLHGNLADLKQVAECLEADPSAVLLSLGDLFHGPNIPQDLWDLEYTHLGDFYEDESPALFEQWLELINRFPDRVAAIMGNHEHAHVGGPIVAKFYDDEAGAFESQMEKPRRLALRRYIRQLPLIAVTDCGVAFTHGAPPAAHFDRESLRSVPFSGYESLPLMAMYGAGFLGELLWRRTSSEADCRAFLGRLNALSGCSPANVVVYGHDRVVEGYAKEHDALVCLSTSYGMCRAQKTWLRLDLAVRIGGAQDLRPGYELLPLYPHT
jgi:hypothetical protein